MTIFHELGAPCVSLQPVEVVQFYCDFPSLLVKWAKISKFRVKYGATWTPSRDMPWLKLVQRYAMDLSECKKTKDFVLIHANSNFSLYFWHGDVFQ